MAGLAQPGFVVDFVGLPGAGKSTLSRAVADALRAAGANVAEPTQDVTRAPNRRLRKLAFAARTLLRHPWSSLVVVRHIIATRQRTARDLWSCAFNFLYTCGLVAKITREPGIHLLDQGYFNALWGISFSASRPMPLASLIRAGFHCCGRDRLDLVLLIDVQPEVVLARLRARPGTASRLEGRGGTDRFGARLDAALRAVEQIRSSLEELAERGQRWMRLAAVDEDAPQGGEQTEAIVALVCRAWKADTGGQTATCGHRQPSMAVRP